MRRWAFSGDALTSCAILYWSLDVTTSLSMGSQRRLAIVLALRLLAIRIKKAAPA